MALLVGTDLLDPDWSDVRHALVEGGHVALCGSEPAFIWETTVWPGAEGTPAACVECQRLGRSSRQLESL